VWSIWGKKGMFEVQDIVQNGGADSLNCLVVLEESYKCVNIKLVKKRKIKKTAFCHMFKNE
jgi:hypothetical protein